MSALVTVVDEHGEHQVLAAITDPSERPRTAKCSSRGCPVEIQPTATGDLADGVRAHYRTVHPERGIR